jgi:hypothetical protein
MTAILTEAERRNYNRYNRLANTLNKEAYRLQVEKHRGRPLAQFNPCQKALVFTAALSKNPIPVTGQVIPVAAQTICPCHQGLSTNDLYTMLLKESAK